MGTARADMAELRARGRDPDCLRPAGEIPGAGGANARQHVSVDDATTAMAAVAERIIETFITSIRVLFLRKRRCDAVCRAPKERENK